VFVNFISLAKKGEEILSNTTFSDITLSAIADGSYTGEFGAGPVYVKAQVTVKNGVMTEIMLLEHDNGKGSAAEGIVDKMLQSQTTNVDLVSGATYSSKVIRKAVENALLRQ
ncbi:MAG: FMN-binding protein, partial [Acidithiobacillus sp.]